MKIQKFIELKKHFLALSLLLLVFVTCCFLSQKIFAQDLFFEHISNLDGLSNNAIHSIIQDRQGYIWIGTDDGLNRYDGYQFKHFRYNTTQPSNNISSNHICTIYQDLKDNIWIGTAYGLSIYNPVKDNFSIQEKELSEFAKENTLIHCFYQDLSGVMWIGTKNGLVSFDSSLGKLTRYQLPNLISNFVTNIVEDSQKNLWLATFNGLWSFDRAKQEFTYYKTIGHLELDKELIQTLLVVDKTLWVGSVKGLYEVDTETKEIKNFFSYGNIRALFLNEQGLWLGTHSTGLKLLNLETKKLTTYQNSPKDPQSLIGDYVEVIYQDRTKVLWVGDFIYGISKYSFYKNKFRLYKSNPYDQNSLSNNYIRGIYQDKSQDLWVGTQFGGLNKIDRKQGIITRYLPSDAQGSIAGNSVWAIYQDHNEELWIGLANKKGLQLLDKKTSTFKNVALFPHTDDVNLIYEDKAKNLWIGSTRGVYVLSPDRKAIQHYFTELGFNPTDTVGEVFAFCEDSLGILWIGTQKGIVCYNPSTLQFTLYDNLPGYLSGIYITHVLEAKDKSLWVSTKGLGIYHISQNRKNIIHITAEKGLPHNNVYAILQDQKGCFWLSSDNGIARYDHISKLFKVFTPSDGLQGKEFNRFAFFQNPNTQEIFFGGTNGLNSFYPNDILLNRLSPSMVVSSFTVNGNALPIDKKATKLTYSENTITFSFSALDFNSPSRNLYKYILDGLDTNWSNITSKNEITYSNLPSGKYCFRVKAANSDEIWNEVDSSVEFIIYPPWWKSWWAYFIYLFSISSTLYIWAQVKLQRIKIQGQLRETELNLTKVFLEKENTEIKTEYLLNKAKLVETDLKSQLLRYQLNPHFLFNTFGSIRTLIRINPRLAEEMTLSLCDYMRGLLINRSSLETTLSQEIKSTESYLEIEKIRFQNKLQIKFSIDNMPKDLIIPAFILQPLVENAVKYGMKTGTKPIQVEVKVDTKDNELLLSVINNGKLLVKENNSNNGLGISLSIIEERLKQIYPMHHCLSMKEEDGQVSVTISLPIK